MYEWISICNAKHAKRKYRNPLVEKLHKNREIQQEEANGLRGKVKEINLDLD
jgi:hypothetical protein